MSIRKFRRFFAFAFGCAAIASCSASTSSPNGHVATGGSANSVAGSSGVGATGVSDGGNSNGGGLVLGSMGGAVASCVGTSAPGCGDGIVQAQLGEECDDGNSVSGDGCSGVCKVEPYYTCPTAAQPCVTTIVCGDGKVGPGEACDDGNHTAGDGCAADCRSVEKGYACPTPGSACMKTHVCGDGNVDSNEGCDDGNNAAGDGCDVRCRIELGFKCGGQPSACTKTVCGDGKLEGAESCDDGNGVPFDGCSATCQAEPACATGTACTSTCGDGIVLGDEQCDDGNLRNGDGCSNTCKFESGFTCDTPTCVKDAKGDCTMTVPAIFRDQDEAKNADFENDKPPNSTIIAKMVTNQLAADNKPSPAGLGGYGGCTLTTGCIHSAATFNQWYHDTAGINIAYPGSIVLYQNADGKYVNRWGANGQQWQAIPQQVCSNNLNLGCATAATDCPAGGTCVSNINWCANAGATCDDPNCAAQVATGATCFSPCTPFNQTSLCTAHALLLDGNPVFFPIDKQPGLAGTTRHSATIPQPVYFGNWADETGKPLHNFGFTSEVRYWFQYDSAAPAATFDFVGDDDVWVFVNGKLALDLGGWHVPLEKTFTLDTAFATSFGLKNGQVYQISIFQAERMVSGSSFKLTLSGFNAAPSDCHSTCGDAIVASGEACDLGSTMNTGAYNGCNADCTPGPHCGDGIAHTPEEACDDGDGKNTGAYGGCAPNCQLGPFCGDGVVQSSHEQCDDGKNTGAYGTCAAGCVLGPRCGDGIVQLDQGEECDEGEMNGGSCDGNGTSCTTACKIISVK